MEEKLIALLLNKKEKMKEILKLTQEQNLLIEKNDYTAFLKSLEERQKIMSKIDILDQEVESERNRLGDIIDKKNYSEAILEIKMLLQQIIALDNGNNARLNVDLNQVKLKVKELQGNKAIHKAYAPFSPQQRYGFFIDKKK